MTLQSRRLLKLPNYKRLVDTVGGVISYTNFNWKSRLISGHDIKDPDNENFSSFPIVGEPDGDSNELIAYPRTVVNAISLSSTLRDELINYNINQTGFDYLGNFFTSGYFPTLLTTSFEPWKFDFVQDGTRYDPESMTIVPFDFFLKNILENRWIGGDAIFLYVVRIIVSENTYTQNITSVDSHGNVIVDTDPSPLNVLIDHDVEVLNRISPAFNRVRHVLIGQRVGLATDPHTLEVSAIFQSIMNRVNFGDYFFSTSDAESQDFADAAVKNFYPDIQ